MHDAGDAAARIIEVEVAVRSVTEAAALLASAFGTTAEPPVTERSPGIGITMSSLRLSGARLGFIEDVTGTGPVARFLERRGEGLYSVLIEVADIAEVMQRMRVAGVRFVRDEAVRLENVERGGEQFRELRIAWTHPSTTHGVLIELQERHR